MCLFLCKTPILYKLFLFGLKDALSMPYVYVAFFDFLVEMYSNSTTYYSSYNLSVSTGSVLRLEMMGLVFKLFNLVTIRDELGIILIIFTF